MGAVFSRAMAPWVAACDLGRRWSAPVAAKATQNKAFGLKTDTGLKDRM